MNFHEFLSLYVFQTTNVIKNSLVSFSQIRNIFTSNLSFFVRQRLYRGCGRSTTHPLGRWSRRTSTMSWDSTRSQVSQRLWLCLYFFLLCGFSVWVALVTDLSTCLNTPSSHHQCTTVFFYFLIPRGLFYLLFYRLTVTCDICNCISVKK